MMMSRAQELQFELMREARFNDFEPAQVIDDLIANRSLWHGAIMDSRGLLKLRDVDELWNVDTLYIASSGEDDAALEVLARQWHADEVDWIAKRGEPSRLSSDNPDDVNWFQGSSIKPFSVLRVWWD